MNRLRSRSRRALLFRRVALGTVIGALPQGGPAQNPVQAAPQPVSIESCVLAPPPPRSIRPGACVRSSLDEQDESVSGSSEVTYEDHMISLRAGEAIRIDMDAVPAPAAAADAGLEEGAPLDTYLEVHAGTEDGPLDSNDDREDSLDSTLTFIAPEAGTYRIRATSFGGGTGEYVLRVRNVRPPRPPLALGSSRAGRLTPADMIGAWEDHRGRGARFFIDGAAGERIRIALSSRIPSAALALYDGSGSRIGSAAAPDGSGDLVAILPSQGRYFVQLTALNLAQAQDFRLGVARAASGAESTAAPIRLAPGGSVEGELRLDSPALGIPGVPEDGYFYQLYELPVEAGQLIDVQMASDAFAPLVEAGAMSVIGFATAVEGRGISGQDGTRTAGMRTAAHIRLRPQGSGILLLRARSRGLEVGRFTLRVTVASPEPPAQ